MGCDVHVRMYTTYATQKLLEVGYTEPEVLSKLVDKLFDKALTETTFSEVYAQLAARYGFGWCGDGCSPVYVYSYYLFVVQPSYIPCCCVYKLSHIQTGL